MEKASVKVAFMAVLLVIGFGLQLKVEGRLEKGAQNEAMVGATLPLEPEQVQCTVPSDCIGICSKAGCRVSNCILGLCECEC